MNDVERGLLDALHATNRYRLSGRKLELLDGNKPMAGFEARE
jgi:hypothetical protein